MALNANALTTVATMKSHLAITSSLEDTRLELFINAASEVLEKYCDRKFKSATYTEIHSGSGNNILMPLQYPLISITELRIRTDFSTLWTDATTLIASTEYAIIDDSQSVQYNGAIARGFGNVRLIYVAGFATIPSDLELACIWAAEWFFKHRERGDMGRTTKSKSDESVGILASMPPMVLEIASAYKRTELPIAEVQVCYN
jgi:hypothetical protein